MSTRALKMTKTAEGNQISTVRMIPPAQSAEAELGEPRPELLLLLQGSSSPHASLLPCLCLPHVNPLTVRRIVVRHLFRLLTNIKPCRTMRTSQPNPPNLVAVDITQRLPVQDMLEVGCRIARVDDRPSGGLTRARFVQKG